MNLFNPAFWFNQRPGLLIPFWRNSLIASLILFLILAIFAFLFKKKGGLYSKLWERLFNLSSTSLFIGLALLFFNDQMIPVLSARFWYLLWAIGLIIWSYFIIRYATTLPNNKKDLEKKREFEKYLPK